MLEPNSVVFVIDEDRAVRAGIENLLVSVGQAVQSFSSPAEYLEHAPHDALACLVLGIHPFDTSGLEHFEQLASRGMRLPIVLITGSCSDIPATVRAFKSGAVELLSIPFKDEELLDAVKQALQSARAVWREATELHALRARFGSLTPREREVFELVVTGRLNKQIAAELGISEGTVKIHRGQVMYKTGAQSVAELVRTSERISALAARRGPLRARTARPLHASPE